MADFAIKLGTQSDLTDDAAPIAAPDDQGSKKSAKGDLKWGLIPIQEFSDYHTARAALVDAMVAHHGSLYYPDPAGMLFEFKIACPDFSAV